jgi:hypothetical protein
MLTNKERLALDTERYCRAVQREQAKVDQVQELLDRLDTLTAEWSDDHSALVELALILYSEQAAAKRSAVVPPDQLGGE